MTEATTTQASVGTRRRLSGVQLVLLAVGVCLLAVGVTLFRTAPAPEGIAAAGEEAVLREVQTLTVREYAIRPQARVAGMLEGRRDVNLYAETNGPVVAVGAEQHDRVKSGQVLVRVDPLLAEVAVERAEATVARSESQLALARSNLARRRSLFERDIVSDSVLDDAMNAERVAAATLREAQAELKRARDDLDNKVIRAPFSGVLRSFPVEVGEYVREGQELGEILDLAAVRSTVGLTDREVVAVAAGQPVTVRVEALEPEVFEGVILRVGAAADPTTKKFPVEVEVANPDGRLLPGMVVRIGLDLGEPVARTVVPREATLDEFGLRFVYVVESDGNGSWVARQRRIIASAVPFRPGELEVVSGLDVGEQIAISEIRQLRDGERIRPRGKGAI